MKLLFVLFVVAGLSSHAETGVFEISGMKCGSCVKNLKNQVCKIDSIETCEINVGKMTLKSKSGLKLNRSEIESAVSFNGHYSIIKSSYSNN